MFDFMPIIVVLLLAALAYRSGMARALNWRANKEAGDSLHSLPGYYGIYVALWSALPAFVLLLLWRFSEGQILFLYLRGLVEGQLSALNDAARTALLDDIRRLAHGEAVLRADNPVMVAAMAGYERMSTIITAAALVVLAAVSALGIALARRRLSPRLRARNAVEKALLLLLMASATIAILTTIGIVLSLLGESLRFFGKVPLTDFLFGLTWSPQTAIRADQVGSSGSFGAVPLFAGTFMISLIAMAVAVPVGLMSAIYMAEYASPRFRDIVKPLLEILAGIPTVVYGFFAALTVAPLLRDGGALLGFDVASESALAAGMVMGIMLIPFISSLSDDVITAVPRSLREGAYGLGATKYEAITQVVLPAALPGVAGSILLAVSRAIGETMIVVMAAGLSANLTANPFEAMTTVTVQIVTLLIGDQEFDSAKTLAAFALGLVLFVMTLILNIAALMIIRKYREKYD